MDTPKTFVTTTKKTNATRGMPNPPLYRKPLADLWKGTAAALWWWWWVALPISNVLGGFGGDSSRSNLVAFGE